MQLNEELVLNERCGIPQLIRELETLQTAHRGDSIETVGKILLIWHSWANKLGSKLEFGKLLSKLQSLQSLKRIRTYLSDERERKFISKAERTSVLSDSEELLVTTNSPRKRRDLNAINEDTIDSENFSSSPADCLFQNDSDLYMEATQELDFTIDDCRQDTIVSHHREK